MHHILSAVTARLQHAAASHPSRLQQALPTPSGASSGGTAAGGGAAASNSGASASLVELLQRLTESVVGLIEGLAVEKECLESQMLHAGDEAAQLRSQVRCWCSAGRLPACLGFSGFMCMARPLSSFQTCLIFRLATALLSSHLCLPHPLA